MKDKETRDKINAAFRQSNFKWRTARGISKDSGVPIEQVVDFLEKSDDILRAKKANARGQALYTLRQNRAEEESLGHRLLSAMLNRPE